VDELDEVVNLMVNCIESGGKILTFGVGGNAANSVHFSAELSGKFEKYENPLPCICLSENPAILTAVTNDFGWENVFSRQILALAKPNDLVIAFSISTNGAYLRNALAQALVICKVVLICGRNTLDLSPSNSVIWELGSDDTPSVQEEQLRIIHKICKGVKGRFCNIIQ